MERLDPFLVASNPGSGTCNGVIRDQNHNRTDYGDKDASKIDSGHTLIPKLLENEAADNGSDDSEHYVPDQTLSGVVDDLATYESSNQSDY
jgi:hypothetical protein